MTDPQKREYRLVGPRSYARGTKLHLAGEGGETLCQIENNGIETEAYFPDPGPLSLARIHEKRGVCRNCLSIAEHAPTETTDAT